MPSKLKTLAEIGEIVTKSFSESEGNLFKAATAARKQVPKEQYRLIEPGIYHLYTKEGLAQGLSPQLANLRAYFKYGFDSGHLVEPTTTGTWSDFTKPMLPAMRQPISKVNKRKLWGQPLWSHSNTNEWYFGSKGNPSYDWLDVVLGSNVGKSVHGNEWERLFSGFEGLRKNKEFQASLSKAISPLLENGVYQRYLNNSQEAATLMEQLGRLKKSKALETNKKLAARWDKGIARLQELRPQINADFQLVEQARLPFLKEWAVKAPAARMSLALEPSSYPWVTNLLTDAEKKVVTGARQYLDKVKANADKMGIPMIEKEYAPHVWRSVMESLPRFSTSKQAATRIWDSLPQNARWMRRMAGSVNWFPDIDLQMRVAINQANDKLGRTAFLQKWRDYVEGYGTWQGKGLKQERPQAYAAFKRFADEYVTREANPTTWGKALDWMVWGEYLTKIGGSPVTATKHGFKQLFALAYHPKETLQAIDPLLRSTVRNTLQRWGLPTQIEDRALAQMLSAKYMYRAMTGLESGFGGRSAGMRIAELASSSPTSLVEYGERGIGIFASIMKGMDHKMSYHEILRGVYQTMLDLHFMGNVDRPSWLNHPLKRLTALFFYTPFKIVERVYFKHPVGTAGYLNELWKNRGQMVEGLKGALSKGDIQKLKEGIWSATVNAPRDAFGTNYAHQMAKALIALGATEYFFQKFTDTSILGHAIHWPGLRKRPDGSTEITMPWWYEIYQNYHKYGADEVAMRTVLVDHYWPTFISRLQRTSEGTMPEKFDESKLRYFTGLGKESIIQEQMEKAKAKGAPKAQRLRERKEKYMLQNLPEPVRRFLGY